MKWQRRKTVTAILNRPWPSLQNQAQFVSEMTDINRRYNELKEETAKRLANIEALLIQHDHLLKNLPEAIREKIGFKAK